MQCYRLSSVRLDECDTTAFGWTTYINPKHITQKWSDALAQRLPPPPHVPRGAGWISRHIAPPPPLSAALSRQFKALDIDHDGKLTEREFTDALTRHAGGHFQLRRRAFSLQVCTRNPMPFGEIS
jgi:hypothetical protein